MGERLDEAPDESALAASEARRMLRAWGLVTAAATVALTLAISLPRVVQNREYPAVIGSLILLALVVYAPFSTVRAMLRPTVSAHRPRRPKAIARVTIVVAVACNAAAGAAVWLSPAFALSGLLFLIAAIVGSAAGAGLVYAARVAQWNRKRRS